MKANPVQAAEPKRRSNLGAIWFRFRKNKIAVFALIIFCGILLMTLSADLFMDYETDAIRQNLRERLLSPCAEHLMGTDAFGRDIFARVVYGARMSLLIAITVVAAATLLGLILGSCSAFYGGIVDNVIMRICDVFLSVPHMLMSVTVVAALGRGVPQLVIALIISQTPTFTRIVRSSVMQVMSQDFIESAKAYGTHDLRLVVSHILPNALSPIIVKVTMDLASVVLQISGLGFIGLGIPAPTPEWGTMVAEARERMLYYPHLIIFPGLALALTVLCATLIGDGIRDALDPKLKN